MVSIIFDVSIDAAGPVYAAKLQAANLTADDTSGERDHYLVSELVPALGYINTVINSCSLDNNGQPNYWSSCAWNLLRNRQKKPSTGLNNHQLLLLLF